MKPAPSSADSRARGRPRGFDVDAITERALAAFWEQGYEATSVADLLAATGLSASSVYAAYGSKQGLFRAAIQRYEEHMGRALGDLADGDGGLADVVEFVEHVRAGIGSDARPAGCLMVNTMVEVPARDPVIGELTSRYRARVRESLERALARAERSGEITRRSGRARAALVQAALFGALVTGRAGAVDEADRMLRGLISEIRRWGH
jgi:TetR/AcrR family transcriptional repressor of nem operon